MYKQIAMNVIHHSPTVRRLSDRWTMARLGLTVLLVGLLLRGRRIRAF
jgi:hypothetical protein